jgi:hypothetical protein
MVHASAHSQDALIEYANGDRYQGVVIQGKKSGAGGTYTYRNGDVYEGAFQNDKKHAESGKMKFPRLDAQYYGHFYDDKKVGKGVYEFGENSQFGSFKGYLDKNEDISGPDQTFEFPMQKMTYTGEFQKNQMHGQG